VTIAGLGRIADFASDHPDARGALDRWRNVVAAAEWKNPAELKKTFATASVVGDQTVFNIGGNKYRLIALIQYRAQHVLIQHVLTHVEYHRNRGDWKV